MFKQNWSWFYLGCLVLLGIMSGLGLWPVYLTVVFEIILLFSLIFTIQFFYRTQKPSIFFFITVFLVSVSGLVFSIVNPVESDFLIDFLIVTSFSLLLIFNSITLVDRYYLKMVRGVQGSFGSAKDSQKIEETLELKLPFLKTLDEIIPSLLIFLVQFFSATIFLQNNNLRYAGGDLAETQNLLLWLFLSSLIIFIYRFKGIEPVKNPHIIRMSTGLLLFLMFVFIFR